LALIFSEFQKVVSLMEHLLSSNVVAIMFLALIMTIFGIIIIIKGIVKRDRNIIVLGVLLFIPLLWLLLTITGIFTDFR